MPPQLSCAVDPPLVALQNAEKRYGDRTVLRVDKFNLNWKDLLLITGPNGSGKSTLMRVLAGVSTLSSGTVIHSAKFDSLKTCYVPQFGGLHLNLSVADNLRLWYCLVGSEEPENLAEQWYIQHFDLQGRLHSRCGDLSGGFQRLAALACALATRPDGLFVDEPLSGIDAPHAKMLVHGLGTAMADLSFLVVTGHSATEISQANRVIDLSGSNLP